MLRSHNAGALHLLFSVSVPLFTTPELRPVQRVWVGQALSSGFLLLSSHKNRNGLLCPKSRVLGCPTSPAFVSALHPSNFQGKRQSPSRDSPSCTWAGGAPSVGLERQAGHPPHQRTHSGVGSSFFQPDTCVYPALCSEGYKDMSEGGVPIPWSLPGADRETETHGHRTRHSRTNAIREGPIKGEESVSPAWGVHQRE